jgi:hypothetical protein
MRNPEVIEPLGDFQLVVTGQRNTFTLGTVSQCGVIQKDSSHLRTSSLLISLKSQKKAPRPFRVRGFFGPNKT